MMPIPESRSHARGASILLFSFFLLVCCAKRKEWPEPPGFKRHESWDSAFSGLWIGGDGGEMELFCAGQDSIRGTAQGGAIRIRGRHSGSRADIMLRAGEGGEEQGYLYLIPNTDSLSVGLRDSSGSWSRFFPMVSKGRKPPRSFLSTISLQSGAEKKRGPSAIP